MHSRALLAAVLSLLAACPAVAQTTQPDPQLSQQVAQLQHRVAQLEAEVRFLRQQLAHTQLMALAADTEIRLLPPPPLLAPTLTRLAAPPTVQVDHSSVQALVDSMVRIAAAGDAAATYELLPPDQRDAVREFDRTSLSAWHNYYSATSLLLRNYHEQSKRIKLTFWVQLTLFADDFLRRMDPQARFKVVEQKRGNVANVIIATLRDRDGEAFEMSFVTDAQGQVYQPMPATIGLADPQRVIETARFIRDYFGRLARDLAGAKINPVNFENEMTTRASEFVEKMKALQTPK